MNVSIFGLGYVGCVAMACLAKRGHRMLGVDPQLAKVEFINQGRATIIENGIDTLLAEQHASRRIAATNDGPGAVFRTDVSFICVGTPSTPDGHLDLSAIFKVASDIGRALRQKPSRHLVAIRSTALPGTADSVTKIIAHASGRVPGVDFAVVANPEFLREGSSIADFDCPPFTLIGSHCDWAIATLRELYSQIDAPFIVVDPKVAELMKYVCNSFHALKICFANEVGNICKKLGIDSHDLMDIFCQDTHLNISKAYLKPGFAYGGSCLPKDLKALQTIAHDNYLQTPVLESIQRSNELQKERVLNCILESGKQNIGFLGLAFKSGTDDLRESPIVDVIERLLGKGFNIRIYDRNVHLSHLTGANREFILRKIPYIARFITDQLPSVLDNSELVVVVNNEASLKDQLLHRENGPLIYDLARLSANGHRPPAGYLGISW